MTPPEHNSSCLVTLLASSIPNELMVDTWLSTKRWTTDHISNFTEVLSSNGITWVRKAAADRSKRKLFERLISGATTNLQLYSPGSHQTGFWRIEGRDCVGVRWWINVASLPHTWTSLLPIHLNKATTLMHHVSRAKWIYLEEQAWRSVVSGSSYTFGPWQLREGSVAVCFRSTWRDFFFTSSVSNFVPFAICTLHSRSSTTRNQTEQLRKLRAKISPDS